MVPALEVDAGRCWRRAPRSCSSWLTAIPMRAWCHARRGERARLQQWLSFIGTELHKTLYVPLMDTLAPPEVKAYALAKVESRLAWLAPRLEGRTFLFDHFTIADAYLFAVLNWSAVTPVDLGPWPAIRAYHAGLHQHPSVARAFAEDARAISATWSARPSADQTRTQDQDPGPGPRSTTGYLPRVSCVDDNNGRVTQVPRGPNRDRQTKSL